MRKSDLLNCIIYIRKNGFVFPNSSPSAVHFQRCSGAAVFIKMPNIANGLQQVKLVTETKIDGGEYDGILLVATPNQEVKNADVTNAVSTALKYDKSLEKEVAVLPVPGLPSGRLVYSPTGLIDVDYDDVRSFRDAAIKGVKRLLRVGIKKPLLLLPAYAQFPKAQLVTLLGVLETLYVPIQVRELDPSKSSKVNFLGVYAEEGNVEKLIHTAQLLDYGRSVARDIGDADPERMTPKRVEEYIKNCFSGTSIKIQVVDDEKQIAKEFPLFEAVNRAASVVERHRGRILFLEYNPPDASKVKETLFLVGKGVTYDTGGCDIKAGGIMAGMSRDKCGAATVAGFLATVSLLQPQNVRVVGGLSMVRNSVGSNGYVADELIKARSGAKVRIGNTDAEGRMVMADVLCKFKELALEAVNPHLFTIATLTGHAYLTVGEGYSIVIDNGPARTANTAQKLQQSGAEVAEPFEISTVRREDISFNAGKAEGDDLMQCNNAPSSRTPRGHQVAVGFLLGASGLNEHGSSSSKPLKYTHLDIAGSAGTFPNPATGAPLVALADNLLLRCKGPCPCAKCESLL